MIPSWQGATVVIVGGGPSLTLADVALVREAHAAGRIRCIVVNNAFKLMATADMLYAADAAWWALHPDALAFAGLKCAVENGDDAFPAAVHVIPAAELPIRTQYSAPAAGDTELVAGRNSLHQALNIAVLAGASTVILLGCDGRPGEGGRTHFHAGHGKSIPDSFWSDMRRSFSAQEHALTARGVKVWNCSPGSAVNSFEKVNIEMALALDGAKREAGGVGCAPGL